MWYFFSWLSTYSGQTDELISFSWWVFDVTLLDDFIEQQSREFQRDQQNPWTQPQDAEMIPEWVKSLEYLWYVASWTNLWQHALHNTEVIQILIDTKAVEQEKKQEQQKQEQEEKDQQNETWNEDEEDGGNKEKEEEEWTSEEWDASEENKEKGDSWDEENDWEKTSEWDPQWSQEGEMQEWKEQGLSEDQKDSLEDYAEQLQQQQAQQQQYFNKKPQPNDQQPQDLLEALFGRQQMRKEVDTGGEVDW